MCSVIEHTRHQNVPRTSKVHSDIASGSTFFVRTTLTFEVICDLLLNQCNRQHEIYLLNRLRGLSLRLRQQGFVPNLLQKSSNKFFNRHGLIVMKYGATLREMRLAIQARITPSYPYITYLLLIYYLYYFSIVSWYVCARNFILCASIIY